MAAKSNKFGRRHLFCFRFCFSHPVRKYPHHTGTILPFPYRTIKKVAFRMLHDKIHQHEPQ
jgi:hypothetical protein